MAAPIPTTNVYKNGKAFVATWNAIWTNTTNHTDSIVVNLSDLNFTNRITIYSIVVTATAGISARLEFYDASADVLIYTHPLGVADSSVLDFTCIGGLQWDGQTTSDPGDILLTTLSAAAADEVSVVIVGKCS